MWCSYRIINGFDAPEKLQNRPAETKVQNIRMLAWRQNESKVSLCARDAPAKPRWLKSEELEAPRRSNSIRLINNKINKSFSDCCDVLYGTVHRVAGV